MLSLRKWCWKIILRTLVLLSMGRKPELGAKEASEWGQLPAEYVQNLEDRLSKVELLEDEKAEKIPVIDFSGKHEDVVEAVAEACREWGFFQAVNHCVPVSSIQAIFKLAKEFFDLPRAEKEANNDLGQQVVSEDSAGVCTYGVAFSRVAGKAIDWRDFLRLDYNAVKKANAWPETPASFKDSVKDYNEHILKFAKNVLDIISEGLGLAARRSLSFHTEKQIFMMNYYPRCNHPELVNGLTPHSDPRSITILLQDTVGGLEVSNHGKWYPVKPVENAFVVNLGDHLQIVSNGRYKSAEHRVRVNAEESRFSIPVFFGPALEAEIGPLPELVSEAPAVYRNCTSKDYVNHFYGMGLAGKAALDYVKI